MARFGMEAHKFKQKKQQEADHARQTAAFFIACGIDLAAALSTHGDARIRMCKRLGRLIERERLRGMRRHWSYDLNRHIALKQVLRKLEPASQIGR